MGESPENGPSTLTGLCCRLNIFCWWPPAPPVTHTSPKTPFFQIYHTPPPTYLRPERIIPQEGQTKEVRLGLLGGSRDLRETWASVRHRQGGSKESSHLRSNSLFSRGPVSNNNNRAPVSTFLWSMGRQTVSRSTTLRRNTLPLHTYIPVQVPAYTYRQTHIHILKYFNKTAPYVIKGCSQQQVRTIQGFHPGVAARRMYFDRSCV